MLGRACLASGFLGQVGLFACFALSANSPLFVVHGRSRTLSALDRQIGIIRLCSCRACHAHILQAARLADLACVTRATFSRGIIARLRVRSFTVLTLHTATGVVSVAGSPRRALHACGSVGRRFPSGWAQLALAFVLIWDQPVINLALLTQSCLRGCACFASGARHTCGPTLIGLLSISTERATAPVWVWHLIERS